VRYTLKGDAEEVYTPHFTFHGFRYVKVEGFPGMPSIEQFTGLALYSGLPETGTFECSDPLINRLQQNILWSQKSNFLEIPTDCPTRERAGWTGDVQVFARTGSFLMQTAGFLSKWLKDLAMEQAADGRVAELVPSPQRARPGKAARVPSWLYEVKKGATTMWEAWDGIGEDGTPKGSLNHYSKGAVGSWLYQVVAGIEPGTPGYKHMCFQPRPGGSLTAASARYHSLYGEIASSWQMRDGRFTLTITVPANTTATVFLPGAEARQVTERGQVVETVEGVIQVSQEQEATVIEVGSGTYVFAYPFSRNNE
jgi:hypothetical protein